MSQTALESRCQVPNYALLPRGLSLAGAGQTWLVEGRVDAPARRRGGPRRTKCTRDQHSAPEPRGHADPPARGSPNWSGSTIITPINKSNDFNLKDIKLTAGFVPAYRAWLSCSEQAPETGSSTHRPGLTILRDPKQPAGQGEQSQGQGKSPGPARV